MRGNAHPRKRSDRDCSGLHSQSSGCHRHQLHQPYCALGRDHARLPVRLAFDNRTNQRDGHPIVLRAGCDVVLGFKSTRWSWELRPADRDCRKHLRQDECWFHAAVLRRASALYCCASKIKLANPSRKSSLRRSASVLANKGRRMSLISAVICSVPRTLSACVRSRISETEGGFSRLHPRSALASPAIPAWNSWLESGVLSATICASRSAVGCSTRR